MARRILDDGQALAARQVLEQIRPLRQKASEIGLIDNKNTLPMPRCQRAF